MKRYGAELFGTFWLVLGGCGSAVLAAAFPDVGIGLHGLALSAMKVYVGLLPATNLFIATHSGVIGT